ncbi:MAG: hypothetical protein MUP47_10275 [Phycisphaerae bacterium]|nr:hypothetical protein [Phycisphaerae bacterium]
MSLIHEALKRVEAQKAPNGPAPPLVAGEPTKTSAVPPLRVASGPSGPPAPPAPSLSRALFTKSPIAMALGMAVAISATVMAMRIVQRDMAVPPISVLSPAPKRPSPVAAQPPKPASVSLAQPTTQPTAAPKVSAPPSPAPAVATLAPAVATPAPPPVAVATPSPPVSPEEPPLAHPVARQPAAASKFKVNGIMSGPTGGAALINGRMVYVGQEVDGARLVAMTANSVELEIEGVRVTMGIQP